MSIRMLFKVMFLLFELCMSISLLFEVMHYKSTNAMLFDVMYDNCLVISSRASTPILPFEAIIRSAY